MSSKSADAAPRHARGRQAGTWSITTRLVVLFTVATSALLFVVVALLYRGVEQHLDEEHDHLLVEVARVLQQASIGANRGAGAIVNQVTEMIRDEAASRPSQYLLRVLDGRGTTLAEMPRIVEIPASEFPSARAAVPGEAVRALRWESPRGGSYVLSATRNRESAAERWVVQVALDVTDDRNLLAALRRKAALLLLVGVLASAVVGTGVARHGLRPLERITSEVAQVTATRLQRKLPVTGWPRELSTLVFAYDGMLDRLNRAFAGLSEFSANLAHELRTPLNNLRGEAEVALMRGREVEEYREVLVSSLDELKRLSTMVDRLLFLARAESGEAEPSWALVLAATEARALCEFYAPIADEKSVTLTVTGDATLRADPDLFRRALGNLLANALHFAPHGGRVEVAITEIPGAAVEVRVRDDGPGIGADDLPHVFERFYRGTNARSRDVAGSGLGLAIVRSIMDLHGGAVDVCSIPGQGTSVTLRFPSNRSS